MSFFEQAYNSDPHRRGMTSTLYTQLLNTGSSPVPSYTSKWERDFEITLEDVDWHHIWKATKSSSQNIVALETVTSFLTRWYLVPARIAKYVPHYPSTCFRGYSTQGNFHHIWWSCPIAQTFWSNLFNILSTLFDTTLQPDPTLALLNLKLQKLFQRQFKLLLQVTTAAKQMIAKSWKTSSLCVLCVQKQGHTSNDPRKNRGSHIRQGRQIRSPLVPLGDTLSPTQF